MRTLKKSLCLVLALVFVLGLCTIGANAAEYAKYTDLADVTYVEAVEVLTGLGVIEGYKDGSFQPGGDVTRAEAAAMIARMMLGRESADRLPVGDVKFTDVPEDNWAAKYIAFCANKGIIVGMGDGTFHPSDKVTGAQLACMLLRALGYGVMGEYEGKGWDINAVADALYYKVFKDSKVTDFNKPATREETALYVWNTMWIQLVGYDVDLNYYEGRWVIVDRFQDRPLTFAQEAYNLVKWDYAQVMENQATGNPYTHVQLVTGYVQAKDDDGKEIKGQLVPEYEWINLDIETGLDLIAHEVTVYFKDELLTDKANKVDYYEVFFIKDESIVLDKGSTYDDFYRNLVAANKDNKWGSFEDFKVWENYQPCIGQDDDGMSYWLDYVDYYGGVLDYDTFFQSLYWTAIYWTQFSDLKGQVSSYDSTSYISGEFILDHNGDPLAAMVDKYWIGQVEAVDDVHDEVEVEYYIPEDDTTDDYIADLNLAYEGIAKDDYVILQPIGELVYTQPTTTKEVEITERNSSYFNYYAYWQDSRGYGIYIEDADDYTDVKAGDKVLFYVSKDLGFWAYYFGLQITEKAGTDGIVFINYMNSYESLDEWGDTVTNYKVQAVNEDGEVVAYKMKEAKYNQTFNGGKYTGVYEATVSGGYATFKKVEGSELTKLAKKNSYLTNNDDVLYYVTSDTNVYYLTQKGSKLEVTAAKSLADRSPAQDYTVYAVAKKSGGSYKLQTVWVIDPVEAPVDYSDTYMFIFKGNNGVFFPSMWLSPSGYVRVDEVETPYYSVYFDGVKTSGVFLTASDAYCDTYFDGVKVAFGFYNHVEKDGVYSIKAVTKQSGPEVLEKGNVKYGKMYTANCDGVTLKVDVVDVSGDTTKDTKKDSSINSIERLEDLLNQGYQITVWYVYKTDSDGNWVPTGTMYVTNVVTPAD